MVRIRTLRPIFIQQRTANGTIIASEKNRICQSMLKLNGRDLTEAASASRNGGSSIESSHAYAAAIYHVRGEFRIMKPGNKPLVKNVQVRMSVDYFLRFDPPAPHRGWNLPAFQDYCRQEMTEGGFDLERKIHCYYNRKTGEIVFWQNVIDLELSPAILN